MRARFSTFLFLGFALATFGSLRLLAQAPIGNPVSVPLKIWVVGEVKSDGSAP